MATARGSLFLLLSAGNPLQGSTSLEHPSTITSSGTQQPRDRHSFVQEHFQAQYRGRVHYQTGFHPDQAAEIGKQSPGSRTPMCVTLVFNAKGQRYLRVGLAVPLFGSVSNLRSMVAEEGSISSNQVILTELYSTGFQRSFSDEDDLTAIADSDVVYAFQAPPLCSLGSSTSSHSDRCPTHAVQRALKLCGSGGPPHAKIVIEWENKIKECLFGSIQEEVVKDAESVRNQQQQHLQQHSCTLDECFQLYTKEEQVGDSS
ncbi:unnamed protein product [Tetraodon nigroviridis]|uniref:(spotted green pufferfish) hypothetical protein n=1 Tax=Tetraodon nigroviridis TaxID=99883 RepID=Q4SZB0_TETNG|nr:unnamed protein product [Tetraodon nigroviridis]